MAEARRTLVKSPPELWAEISDPDCLAKHLGAFGEIQITRVEPETTVAWEGDRARGTVELEASGWGTKVRLTADALEVEVEVEVAEPEVAEPEPVAVQEPEPDPGPAPEPEPEPEPEPVVAEKAPVVAEEPAVAPEPPVEEVPPKRRGFLARWFGRREELRVTTVAPEPPPTEKREADEPAAEVAPPVVDEPTAEAAPPVAAEPVPEEPEAVEEHAPVEEPQAPGEIRVARLGDDEAAEVLNAVLDALGSAHHRPFSRS